MCTLIRKLLHLTAWPVKFADFLQPLLWLYLRVHVALVFFRSGLTKIEDWDTTLLLFSEEYHVPLLPPELAAYAGTTGELLLPLLLIAGLCSRFAATGLFILNVVAVLSYPGITETTLIQHQYWGMLLGVIMLSGAGKLGLDHWIVQRCKVSNMA